MQQKKLTNLLTAVILSLITAQAIATTPPFFPIQIQQIKVPEKVYPWLPTYTPDGKNILFQNQLDGNLWLSDLTGDDVKCLTCNMLFPEQFDSGFTYVLPDMKHIFISKKELVVAPEIADDKQSFDAYIMECANSITDCKTAKFFPVDLSGDKTGIYPPIQRRTWHLSPDGTVLAWTVIRQDGTAVVAGNLTKGIDKYTVTDTKVITPIGPIANRSLGIDKLDYASQMWELKSFADGGKSVIMLNELNQNVDSMKVDLKTGKTTRLTANPDWDEDGAISPDGEMYTLYSWRTRHRLDAMSAIPQLKGFMGFPLMRNLLQNYINQYAGFQCDLSPWLLPANGDAEGRLIGQPLMTYQREGDRVPGNNLAGLPFWSTDSKSVLLQGRNRQPVPNEIPDSLNMKTKGLMDNEIVIAHIDRPAKPANPISTSVIGNWAVSVKEWQGRFNGPLDSQTFTGKKGGTVQVIYSGERGIRVGDLTVIYDHFTEDGKTYISGQMSAHMGAVALNEASTVKINIQLTGEHTGSMNANIVDGAGTWETIYDGVTSPALPAVAPCYSNLPSKNPIIINTQEFFGKLKVTVTASIEGDTRPIQNAVITFANKKVKTNAQGIAYLPVGSTFTVAAGDTFIASSQ